MAQFEDTYEDVPLNARETVRAFDLAAKAKGGNIAHTADFSSLKIVGADHNEVTKLAHETLRSREAGDSKQSLVSTAANAAYIGPGLIQGLAYPLNVVREMAQNELSLKDALSESMKEFGEAPLMKGARMVEQEIRNVADTPMPSGSKQGTVPSLVSGAILGAPGGPVGMAIGAVAQLGSDYINQYAQGGTVLGKNIADVNKGTIQQTLENVGKELGPALFATSIIAPMAIGAFRKAPPPASAATAGGFGPAPPNPNDPATVPLYHRAKGILDEKAPTQSLLREAGDPESIALADRVDLVGGNAQTLKKLDGVGIDPDFATPFSWRNFTERMGGVLDAAPDVHKAMNQGAYAYDELSTRLGKLETFMSAKPGAKGIVLQRKLGPQFKALWTNTITPLNNRVKVAEQNFATSTKALADAQKLKQVYRDKQAALMHFVESNGGEAKFSDLKAGTTMLERVGLAQYSFEDLIKMAKTLDNLPPVQIGGRAMRPKDLIDEQGEHLDSGLMSLLYKNLHPAKATEKFIELKRARPHYAHTQIAEVPGIKPAPPGSNVIQRVKHFINEVGVNTQIGQFEAEHINTFQTASGMMHKSTVAGQGVQFPKDMTVANSDYMFNMHMVAETQRLQQDLVWQLHKTNPDMVRIVPGGKPNMKFGRDGDEFNVHDNTKPNAPLVRFKMDPVLLDSIQFRPRFQKSMTEMLRVAYQHSITGLLTGFGLKGSIMDMVASQTYAAGAGLNGSVASKLLSHQLDRISRVSPIAAEVARGAANRLDPTGWVGFIAGTGGVFVARTAQHISQSLARTMLADSTLVKAFGRPFLQKVVDKATTHYMNSTLAILERMNSWPGQFDQDAIQFSRAFDLAAVQNVRTANFEPSWTYHGRVLLRNVTEALASGQKYWLAYANKDRLGDGSTTANKALGAELRTVLGDLTKQAGSKTVDKMVKNLPFANAQLRGTIETMVSRFGNRKTAPHAIASTLATVYMMNELKHYLYSDNPNATPEEREELRLDREYAEMQSQLGKFWIKWGARREDGIHLPLGLEMAALHAFFSTIYDALTGYENDALPTGGPSFGTARDLFKRAFEFDIVPANIMMAGNKPDQQGNVKKMQFTPFGDEMFPQKPVNAKRAVQDPVDANVEALGLAVGAIVGQTVMDMYRSYEGVGKANPDATMWEKWEAAGKSFVRSYSSNASYVPGMWFSEPRRGDKESAIDSQIHTRLQAIQPLVKNAETFNNKSEFGAKAVRAPGDAVSEYVPDRAVLAYGNSMAMVMKDYNEIQARVNVLENRLRGVQQGKESYTNKVADMDTSLKTINRLKREQLAMLISAEKDLGASAVDMADRLANTPKIPIPY